MVVTKSGEVGLYCLTCNSGYWGTKENDYKCPKCNSELLGVKEATIACYNNVIKNLDDWDNEGILNQLEDDEDGYIPKHRHGGGTPVATKQGLVYIHIAGDTRLM